MKKLSVILVFVMVFSLFAALGFTVSAAGEEVPKLVHEPATITVNQGSKAVLKTVASGKNLHFSWIATVDPKGTFDLSKAAGVKALEALDGSGKMKVSMKTYQSGTDEYTAELIIDGVIDTNYGIACVCTVSNDAGYKATDEAFIFTAYDAPKQAEVDLVAELDVRIGKLIKLACNVYPADDENVEIGYHWYCTPDGNKSNGVLIEDEDYPVLVVDTSAGGLYFYYCTFYIVKNNSGFFYESGVTMIRLHEPEIEVTYSESDVTLDIGKSKTLKANVAINPEKDKEGDYSIDYQWYKGNNNIVGTFTKIKGANTDTLEVTGAESAGKVYYFCEVTFTTMESHTFSNMSSDAPIVVVRSTGEKNAEITQMPKNVKVKENETATFSVKAVNAKSYEWYMDKPGGKMENPFKPVKLENGKNGVVSGADGDTLKIKATKDLDGYFFYCNVYGSNGKYVMSTIAALEVIPDVKLPVQPTITEQPKSVTATVGEDVKLSIKGANTDGGTLVYRWYISDTDNYPDIRAIDDAEEAEYSPDNKAAGVKYYCCAVWNVLGEYEDGPVYSDFAKVEFKEAETTPEQTETNTETETETEETTKPAESETETETEPAATESAPATDTEKTPGPTTNDNPNRTILTVLLIIICVLVAALIAIGITVLVKSGRKK